MFAVVGRRTLQEMLVLEGRLHELSVSLTSSLDADEWAALMSVEYPDVEVSPWMKFLPQIGQIIEMWGTMKFIFALIFYFAVILVSANTMYMSLLERLREFGIMAAIGLRQRLLSRMVLIEGFLMSGLAGLLGGAVGIAFSFYFKNHYIDLSAFMNEISYAETVLQPRLRTYPAMSNMLMPIVIITLLGVIVAMFPARKLKKYRPVDVLREV
jgi:ABC-type antimicrobial peptide transport system permease subunit